MVESAQGIKGRASSMDGGSGDGGAQLQGPDSDAAGVPDEGDWRARLPPATRKRVVIMLNETLRKHLPISVLVRCEIQKEAVRIEEMLYSAAASETEYMRTVFREKLSMENQTEIRQAPVNAEVIPDHNPGSPAPGLLPQGCNPGHVSAIPLMPQRACSLPAMLGQSMLCFSQTSKLHNMSGVPQNTTNEGFTQGTPQDRSAAQIRQLILRQQQIMLMQQRNEQQQKPPVQQHIQQQPLLHPTPVLSTQQPMTLQKFSGLLPGQCTVPCFPAMQPIIVSPQQQQQSIGQQSIFHHGSVSAALQQECTLPVMVQSYPQWTSTMQPDNRNCPLEPLPQQKQEERIRMNEGMQQRQRLLHEMQLQLNAKQQSQKLQQAQRHHLSENDDMYLVVYLLAPSIFRGMVVLLSIGVLVAMLFMVYNHWWDLWQL